MKLFSERHNIRAPKERTSNIRPAMYNLLFICCERYLIHLAWIFPEDCPDGLGICDIDKYEFDSAMKFIIPDLLHPNSSLETLDIDEYGSETSSGYYYNQYALLDLIEFIAKYIKDFTKSSYHEFFGHYHLHFLETDNVFLKFQKEINELFDLMGLLFTLTDKKEVERIVEQTELLSDVKSELNQVREQGLKELIEEALHLFVQPNPQMRNLATEKIWDALERLKTYFTSLAKKDSAEKIVDLMSLGKTEFYELFDDEFTKLTKIGNEFRIRHHETNKIDINDERHFDYFFYRCLNLILTALKFLEGHK